jgi:rod shape-determining protein MreD
MLFVILVLLQVWVLNNIQISGFVNPYLYILFILLLPFQTPNWFILILSFFLGLVIDMFSDTLGMHTSATVFLGFMRPIVLQAITSRDTYEPGTAPSMHLFGLAWFVKYSLILVFSHHLFLFIVEAYSFSAFYLILWRTLVSTFFTTLLIVLSQYIIFRK